MRKLIAATRSMEDDDWALKGLVYSMGRGTRTMQRVVVGFYQDKTGHWAARLECGHEQHVRHDPPWVVREWVLSETGRAGWIGRTMECRKCDELQNIDAR